MRAARACSCCRDSSGARSNQSRARACPRGSRFSRAASSMIRWLSRRVFRYEVSTSGSPHSSRLRAESTTERVLQDRLAPMIELVFVLLGFAGSEKEVDDLPVLFGRGRTFGRQVGEGASQLVAGGGAAARNARSASEPRRGPGRSRWGDNPSGPAIPASRAVISSSPMTIPGSLSSSVAQMPFDHVGGELQIEPGREGRVGLGGVDDLVIGDASGAREHRGRRRSS